MSKRGPKPKRKYDIRWSSNIAYGVGLMVTDGSLSKDGRHIDFTSKDEEQLHNFNKAFNLSVNISYKKSGYTGEYCSRLQFSDVRLYRFLSELGITTAKTKTVSALNIPDEYFFDFLRGHLDGDGSFYSYWDPRWKSSFMYYLSFISYSKDHLKWILSKINNFEKVSGSISSSGQGLPYLRFAKKDSLKILRKMYHTRGVICLSRKKDKIDRALAITGESLYMPRC